MQSFPRLVFPSDGVKGGKNQQQENDLQILLGLRLSVPHYSVVVPRSRRLLIMLVLHLYGCSTGMSAVFKSCNLLLFEMLRGVSHVLAAHTTPCWLMIHCGLMALIDCHHTIIFLTYSPPLFAMHPPFKSPKCSGLIFPSLCIFTLSFLRGHTVCLFLVLMREHAVCSLYYCCETENCLNLAPCGL